MSHIINKHSQLGDTLFNKCFHGVISPRKWLKAGKLLNQPVLICEDSLNVYLKSCNKPF